MEDGYTNWADGQPDHGEDNYVDLGAPSINFEWYDADAIGSQFAYLCEIHGFAS